MTNMAFLLLLISIFGHRELIHTKAYPCARTRVHSHTYIK